MVASSVYGYETDLNQICGVLNGYGYEVWNSHIGSIQNHPGRSNLECCLDAVRGCDALLGIVRPFYGSGVVGERSITHEEMRLAVSLKKPRWFLVHAHVTFARQLLRQFLTRRDPRLIAEAVCGMLNATGGVIAVGVADDGTIIGINDSDAAAEGLQRKIPEYISPHGSWSIVSSEADGKSVLIIDVPSGHRKPYVINGKVFVRKDESNRPATADDINRLIQERIKSDEHWERQPAVGISVGDLDTSEINKTIRIAIEAGRFDEGTTGTDAALRLLNLEIDGRPSQAAVVAFARQVLPSYPQCALRLAAFRGVSKDEFVDQKKVSGNAFRLLDEANTFLGKHLPVRGAFEPANFVRQDRPLYPVLALREW